MTLLSEVLSGAKRIWSAISGELEQAASTVAKDPIFTKAAGELLTDVKQGASNALQLASTAVGPIILVAVKATEAALDAALAAATRGASVKYNAMIDAMIDQMGQTIIAAVQAWMLRTKATLAANSNVEPAGGQQSSNPLKAA